MDSRGKVKNKILVVGDETIDKISLIDEMLGTVSEWKINSENMSCRTFLLDTKYYTCTVEFCVVEKGMPQAQSIGPFVDAFIYIFRPHNNSFVQIKQWLDFVNTHKPNVTLCVCDNRKNDVKFDGEPSEYVDWCIENGFEFILLFPNSTPKSSQLEVIHEKKDWGEYWRHCNRTCGRI